eukprot:171952_1
MAEAVAKDLVPYSSQAETAKQFKDEFIYYLVSPSEYFKEFPGSGPDAFSTWKEDFKPIRDQQISDFKQKAIEWSEKLEMYYPKDGSFKLFSDTPIKHLMGQWLAQKTMVKQGFSKGLSTKQKNVLHELPLGVVGEDSILSIPVSTANVFADFGWLEAIAGTDANSFMFLYNLFQWNSDIHSHENELADLRMSYMATAFITTDSEHTINLVGSMRGKFQTCVEEGNACKKAKVQTAICPDVEADLMSTACKKAKDKTASCPDGEAARMIGAMIRLNEAKCRIRRIEKSVKETEFPKSAVMQAVYRNKPLYDKYLKSIVNKVMRAHKAGGVGAYPAYDDAWDLQLRSNDNLEFGNDNWMDGFSTGGLMGASAVIVVMLVFCVGLAFGLVICWGYSRQKKALEKSKDKDGYCNVMNL